MPPTTRTRGRFGRFLGGLLSNAGGYAVGTATADTLRPQLQPLVNQGWSLNPDVPLTPETAAEAEVIGLWDADRVRQEAAYTGTGPTRTNVLRALAGEAPGLAQLVQLRNRGLITDARFERGLAQLGVREEWRDEVRALRFGTLDAGTLAQLAARGQLELDTARGLAEDAGTNASVFARMVAAASDAPTVGQVLELGNREGSTDAEVAADLEATGLRSVWRGRVAALRHYLTPPSDLIRQAVREAFDPAQRGALSLDAEFPEEFAVRARRLGIDRETATDYWAAHWDLPSYTQATEMLFRGEISEAQFERLLRALDYAPTWRGPLKAIARRIPTMSDFQRLVRREVYNPAQRAALGLDAEYPAEFTRKAALHGMSEQDARDLWAGGWRLPSATQGYRMLWRGEIDEGELGGLLKALDYAPKWRDRLANIARIVPGRIDIRRMLAAGIITPEQARERYQRLGYTASDAAIMVQLAQASTTSTGKDLTLAHLTAEYEGEYIDRAEYLARLESLGYSEAEARQLADLADAKRVARARQQFENRIHSQYVGHKIDRPAAVEALGKAGISEAARARMLTEWDNEKAVNVRTLTQAQILKAYKNGLITREVGLDELTDQGLSDADANRLLDLQA